MRWFLCALVLFSSIPVYADDSETEPDPPIQAIPPGNDVIVPLRKGEPAPYTGQLMDPPTALRWGNWLSQYRLRLSLDVQKAQEVCEAEHAYDEDRITAENARRDAIEKDLRTRILKVEKTNDQLVQELREGPGFFGSVEFGIVLGVIVTATVVAVAK